MNIVLLYAIVCIIALVSILTLISSLRSVRPVVRILKWVNIFILASIAYLLFSDGFEPALESPNTLAVLILDIFIAVLSVLTVLNLLFLVMLLIHKLHPKLMI